jgi:hypothetical protein
VKQRVKIALAALLLGGGLPVLASSAISIAPVKTLKIERELSEEGRACITCHQQVSPARWPTGSTAATP